MIRITTFILAIIIMGYSIYSWNDDSKQSMLILQLLLGFMLAGIGIQNVKKEEKENKNMGLLFLLTSLFCIIVPLIKYLK
ncbi:YczI family protein [Bacillus sp. NP247]|uniref:YczI family protein n=1 Tax=Bacillus sp. NP247 TaxID=2846779 RepID=UPI001C626CD0|nr:YczI family protein [Bacillus sp. NP247]QWU45442.1 YczI family protein [Bacillus sp. NP247]